MSDDGRDMVILHGATPTPEIEIERALVTADQVRRFLAGATPGIGVDAPPAVAPVSFALALRRGHGPEVEISPRAFAIHGGHDIVLRAPIAVGEEYAVSGRVERIYGKTGRSGPLTVVERRVWIRDRRAQTAAEISDRQIVRWKPARADRPKTAQRPGEHAAEPIAAPPDSASLEVGDPLAPYQRRGPTAAEISDWAAALRDREVLFRDQGRAQELGYDDLVVPGPMQSAMVDSWLGAAAPGWRATRLHMTFRQSLLAGDRIVMEAAVIDGDAAQRTLDVLVRNAESGETTSTGTVTLQRCQS